MTLDWSQISLPSMAKTAVQDVLASYGDYNGIQLLDRELFKQCQMDDRFGDYLAQHFAFWRKDGKVALGELLELVCIEFNIQNDNPLLKSAMVACVLGDVENHQKYHNEYHFFEVVVVAMCLAVTHNEITRCPDQRLSDSEILLLFIAACIHDFSHDGQGNIVDGVHIPSRLEKKALDKTHPYLEQAGLNAEDFKKLEMMVICTDASRNSEGRSPAGIARDIFLAHEHDNVSVAIIDDFYDALMDDKKLSLMSILLAEADIAMSSGLNYGFSKYMTRLVAEESSVLQASANTLVGFMEVICHGGYLSRAAQIFLGQNFQAILLEAQEDAEKGVLYA